MAQFFEDLDDSSAGSDANQPFFMVDQNSDDALLTWFSDQLTFLKEHNELRLQKAKNNYARYKGIQYREQVFQPRDLPEKRIRYMPQMVVPLNADVVDEKVARLLEYRPDVQVIPMDNTQLDKADAKIAKRFLKHIDEQESLDTKYYQAVKSAKIAGESFMVVTWDPDKGDELLPAGQTMQLKDGRTIKGPVKTGDVGVKRYTTLNCLYEKARSWEECDYWFGFDNEYTEKLKKEFPDKSDMITSSHASTYYDFETMDMKSLEGRTTTITFYHKKTKFLPQGFECKFAADVILKKGPTPYDHGKLPLIRFIDQENEEELSGVSFLEKIRAMSSQYNNMTNLIVKQQMLASHPKWFIEAGSVDEQSLGNDINLVKVKAGSKPPVLAQGNPVSPQMFEFRKELKEEFYQMAKSNSISQGNLPTGITAFVALQYVSESENRRSSNDVASTNKSIKDTYDLILKTCAQFYSPNDKRTMMVAGKDNRWTVQQYNPKSLQKPYSIILQNSSSLPESKAVRTQYLLDIGQKFPNVLPESQLAEMLDLGQADEFLDVVGQASKAAETENELILDGKGLPDPKIYEDLITHWRIHVASIQDYGFKSQAAPDVQTTMIKHITATEMLMADMAQKSSAFAQLVNVQCPQFPLFYQIEPIMPADVQIQDAERKQALMQQFQAQQQAQAEPMQSKALGPMPGDPAFNPVKQPQNPQIPQGIPQR